MQVKFSEVDTRSLSGNNMDEIMDSALILAGALGFDALVYDYTPVPLDHDGSMITPRCSRSATPRRTGIRSGANKASTR
ncbi:Transcriptional regulator ahyR/asaR family [Pseudomonas sp. FEN]|nr:Transcriptional regulator ahyR/asaR family [Pseudomonas sp. FEN]